MRKFLSVLLTLCMVLPLIAVTAPKASAMTLTDSGSQIPIIRIAGDGEPICDAEDKEVLKFKDIIKAFSSDGGSDADIGGSAKTIIKALADGYKKNDYSEYYEVVYKEMSELFSEIQLDKNGEVTNGTDISKNVRGRMANLSKTDRKNEKGHYALADYPFWYDWRLDPLKIADELHEYITKIKQTTGAEKVSIATRCLGTQVALAYIAKYGTDDIHGLSFDGGTVYGSEPLSEMICGKFEINDGKAALRFIEDLEYYGMFKGFDEFTEATLDMLVKTGAVGTVTDIVRETIYKKIAQGATSAIARSTFFCCPSYWGCVTAEDYQDALNYIFGEEGSDKRKEYAGLIEKLDNYDKTVRQRIPELLQKIKNDGVKVCVIGKYGTQMVPTCESMNLVGDQIASLHRSTFGATTSTVLTTLSDEYIKKQTEAGLGKYISPDKQVDASTCFWPDSTWFIKGVTHSDWTSFENNIAYTVITADRQLTVDDFTDCSQYMVAIPQRDENGNIKYGRNDYLMYADYVKMTEDNCHVEVWADDVEAEKNALTRFVSGFKSWATWLPMFMAKLAEYFDKLIKMISDAVTKIVS